MENKLQRLGLLIDMSRNSVMNVESVKSFLTLLAKMGYNSVMIYTEDTYEVPGHPYFGYMRGRYSISELKEIDDFAYDLGIEVIPCIQVLSHLHQATKWGTIPTDMKDVIMADDEEVHKLIDDMFSAISKAFRSKLIHIGMDEAGCLGRGKHLDKFGYEDTNTILTRHLKKVMDIASKYDFELLIWSDMLLKGAYGGWGLSQNVDIPQEVLDSFPKGVTPIYWDYAPKKTQHFEDMIQKHKKLSKDVWFTGGIYTWYGMVPLNGQSIELTKESITACVNQKLENIYLSVWGDDGGECSYFSVLPALFAAAEYSRGITDLSVIKDNFKACLGLDFDDFMCLDLPNEADPKLETPDGPYPHWPLHPSKYMLFSDYFSDFLDATVNDGVGANYAQIANKLRSIAQKGGEYEYLFDCSAKLCDVFEYKYELGLKTRRAYESHDMDTLRELAENDYKIVIERLNIFHLAFEKQWMKENKPHGFDIQEIRIGGIIKRTESCQRRILDYVNGKIPAIYEYEDELLELPDSANIHSGYGFFASPHFITAVYY